MGGEHGKDLIFLKTFTNTGLFLWAGKNIDSCKNRGFTFTDSYPSLMA